MQQKNQQSTSGITQFVDTITELQKSGVNLEQQRMNQLVQLHALNILQKQIQHQPAPSNTTMTPVARGNTQKTHNSAPRTNTNAHHQPNRGTASSYNAGPVARNLPNQRPPTYAPSTPPTYSPVAAPTPYMDPGHMQATASTNMNPSLTITRTNAMPVNQSLNSTSLTALTRDVHISPSSRTTMPTTSSMSAQPSVSLSPVQKMSPSTAGILPRTKQTPRKSTNPVRTTPPSSVCLTPSVDITLVPSVGGATANIKQEPLKMPQMANVNKPKPVELASIMAATIANQPADGIKVDSGKVNSFKGEKVKVEKVKVERVKVEDVKVGSVKVEDVKKESIKVEKKVVPAAVAGSVPAVATVAAPKSSSTNTPAPPIKTESDAKQTQLKPSTTTTTAVVKPVMPTNKPSTPATKDVPAATTIDVKSTSAPSANVQNIATECKTAAAIATSTPTATATTPKAPPVTSTKPTAPFASIATSTTKTSDTVTKPTAIGNKSAPATAADLSAVSNEKAPQTTTETTTLVQKPMATTEPAVSESKNVRPPSVEPSTPVLSAIGGKAKRNRLKTIPYQSPTPEIELVSKISVKEAYGKAKIVKKTGDEDKLTLFYK